MIWGIREKSLVCNEAADRTYMDNAIQFPVSEDFRTHDLTDTHEWRCAVF